MSKIVYHISGNITTLAPDDAVVVKKNLPVAVYNLLFNPKEGFALEKTGELQNTETVYGDFGSYAKRVVNTFLQRDRNTGTLLTGSKGTGKSMTLRLICQEANKKDIPVILVRGSIPPEVLMPFISQLTERCAFAFDEFDKFYESKDEQNKMLSYMDGLQQNNKLFVFTANNKSTITPYMINRPGRVHYHREYTRLDNEVIKQYAKDNLKGYKEKIDGLIEICTAINTMNFDILQALVAEMNMYDETARQSARLLNIAPEFTDKITWKYTAFHKDKRVQSNLTEGNQYLSPLAQKAVMLIATKKSEMFRMELTEDNMTLKDLKHGKFIYKHGDYEVRVTRHENEDFQF